MKNPFHTLFYIGLSTMLFILSFLTLILVNIKELLPSFLNEKPKIVIRQDVINSQPYKILNQPTIKIKPIEEVITKQTPKIVQQHVTKTQVLPTDTTNHETRDTASHYKTVLEKEVNDSSQSL